MTKASNVHKINPDAVRARYNASKAEKTKNFVDDVSDRPTAKRRKRRWNCPTLTRF